VILCRGTTSHRTYGSSWSPFPSRSMIVLVLLAQRAIAHLPGRYRTGCQLHCTLITTGRARKLRSYDLLGLARVYFQGAQLYAENSRLILKIASRRTAANSKTTIGSLRACYVAISVVFSGLLNLSINAVPIRFSAMHTLDSSVSIPSARAIVSAKLSFSLCTNP
jgi:hypothetical protein